MRATMGRKKKKKKKRGGSGLDRWVAKKWGLTVPSVDVNLRGLSKGIVKGPSRCGEREERKPFPPQEKGAARGQTRASLNGSKT